MLQQLSPRKTTNLLQLRIFPLKDLWLFLLGIIFVSFASGAFGAFMLGVDAEEFFLGERDNILVITQPGISTPFTGQVPLSLQSDIQQILGVRTISPETLGLSVAQNFDDKSIVVRGITSNYTSMASPEVIDGSWFDPHFGSSETTIIYGAMAGYLLAENLGLTCGDTLLLASTLSDTVIDLTITGILRTDSPSDEELIVSLSVGQTMTGKISGYVSFLRVLIDTDVITKEILSDYLTQEFVVPISLTTEDVELFPLFNETPIIAYTPSGQHVKTQYIESGNTTFFHLRFGSYKFVASPPNARQSRIIEVFVNQFFSSPFTLSIGSSYHDLQVQVQYNQQPIDNATVILTEQFGCQCSLPFVNTNLSGIASFSNVPESRYRITVNFENHSYHSIYTVTQSTLLLISLENSFSLTVKDHDNGNEVNGGDLKIFMINGTEIYHNISYSSNYPIFLNPSIYQFEYSFNGISHSFIMNIEGRINKTIFIGSDELHVWVRDADGEGIAANVTVLWPDNSTTSQITDLNGTTVFMLDVYKNYSVSAILLSNRSKIQQISFLNSSNLLIDFFDEYFLAVHVNNGTLVSSSENGLENSFIQVFNATTLVTNGFTNSTGDINFVLSEPGNYTITVSKGDFIWNGFILVINHSTQLNVYLGDVRLVIVTETVSSYPVSGVEVTINSSSGFDQVLITNNSGLAELVVPVGNYSINFTVPGYSSSSEINLTSSQILRVNETIEQCGNVSIALENQFYQSIGQAFVFLRNGYYDYEIKAFSNTEGELSFINVPWGNYSVLITYDDDIYPKQIIQLASFEVELTLNIDTSGPIIGTGNYAFWQDRSFSVVWSSDFVSGFL
ncbi:MAG: ABC transporter permease, partial [Candidatus Hodarchaeales archaeon]